MLAGTFLGIVIWSIHPVILYDRSLWGVSRNRSPFALLDMRHGSDNSFEWCDMKGRPITTTGHCKKGKFATGWSVDCETDGSGHFSYRNADLIPVVASRPTSLEFVQLLSIFLSLYESSAFPAGNIRWPKCSHSGNVVRPLTRAGS